MGFCLVTSAVYTLNDLWDAKTDRLHPKKRRRPIAAGEVSPTAAAVQLAVLLVAGLGFCVASERHPSVIIVLAYVAINLAYNLGRQERPAVGRVFVIVGLCDSRAAGLRVGQDAAVAVAAAMHFDVGVVPGFHANVGPT